MRILLIILAFSEVLSFRINSRMTQSPCRRDVLPLRLLTKMGMVMEDVEASTSSESAKPMPKVPATAWKWPPVWPFPEDSLDAMPGSEGNVQEGGYSPNQLEKLKEHINTFVSEGDKVLEVRSGESQGLVETSDSVLFEDGEIGGNDPLAPLLQFHKPKFPQESGVYDIVVVTDGIESLTNPRDVFREIWRVMKPGGRCLVCFSSKPSKLPPRTSPVKMWTTMTDEQKIWIVGSYFQYSAGPGWKMIEGYDAAQGGGQLEFSEEGGAETAFVVQAEKIRRSLDPSPFEDISFLLLPAKHMGNEDREYSALRLAADVKAAKDEAGKAEVMAMAERLPQIYAVLEKVQDKVIPKPAKALLANLLVSTWTDCPTQVDALRKGLGLTPADAFWQEVGACTTTLKPNAKITFLGEVISQAGVNDKFAGLPAAMSGALAALRAKMPEEEDLPRLQALVANLVVSDYLMANMDSEAAADRVTRYLNSLSTGQLSSLLRERDA